MAIAFLLTGILFIMLAILVGKYKQHNLIAGYNTMSTSKKKKLDINAYGQLFYKVFLITGFIIIIDSLVIFLFGVSEIHIAVFIIPILFAAIYLSVRSKKYIFNEGVEVEIKDNPSRKFVFLIVAISILASFFLVFIGLKEPKIRLSPNNIELKSMYGFKLKYEDILYLDAIDELPKLQYRQNGFAFLGSYKGYFRTQDNLTCKFLIKTDNSPYIYLETINKEKIYFNLKDSKATLKVYSQIKENVNFN